MLYEVELFQEEEKRKKPEEKFHNFQYYQNQNTNTIRLLIQKGYEKHTNTETTTYMGQLCV